ncbi:cell separation protein, partial [Fusobacterium nucleatum]
MGKTFKYLFIAIIVGAGLFISEPAYSFMGYWYDYNSDWIQQDIMRRTYENYNNVMGNNNSSSSSKSTKSTKSTPKKVTKSKITFKSNSNSRGLDYFVNRYPANQREEARAYFKKIQDSFPQVAKSVGIPTNDLSSGMAALVAGAYMAYNNVSLNDDYMKPLQKQFKEAFESVSDYDKMSDSDKKYLYDQMVILG